MQKSIELQTWNRRCEEFVASEGLRSTRTLGCDSIRKAMTSGSDKTL